MSKYTTGSELLPSQVNPRTGAFERITTHVSTVMGKAWFFLLMLLLVIIWAGSFWAFKDLNTWELIINTATTIITFLMVFLIQNTQNRDVKALHHSLNAIARADYAILTAMVNKLPIEEREPFRTAMEEVRQAIGVELQESG